jgi:hypothetical protein
VTTNVHCCCFEGSYQTRNVNYRVQDTQPTNLGVRVSSMHSFCIAAQRHVQQVSENVE